MWRKNFKGLIIGLLVVALLLILAFFRYIGSPLYYKERLLLEYKYDITIPNRAVVMRLEVYDSEGEVYSYWPEEMIEKDVIYLTYENYNNMPQQVLDELDTVLQVIYLDLIINEDDWDSLKPTLDDNDERVFIGDNTYDWLGTSYSERKVVAEDGAQYMICLWGNGAVKITKPDGNGKRKVSMKACFTDWDLAFLGIDYIKERF